VNDKRLIPCPPPYDPQSIKDAARKIEGVKFCLVHYLIKTGNKFSIVKKQESVSE
jgi:hypothetical protein